MFMFVWSRFSDKTDIYRKSFSITLILLTTRGPTMCVTVTDCDCHCHCRWQCHQTTAAGQLCQRKKWELITSVGCIHSAQFNTILDACVYLSLFSFILFYFRPPFLLCSSRRTEKLESETVCLIMTVVYCPEVSHLGLYYVKMTWQQKLGIKQPKNGHWCGTTVWTADMSINYLMLHLEDAMLKYKTNKKFSS